MPLKILIDETVLVDYLGERRPYCACWDKLNALELVGYAQLWTTSEACRKLMCSLAGVIPEDELRAALASTLEYVKVCSIGADDVSYALAYDGAYDEGVLASCVRKVRADYVVTHASYGRQRVPVLTPDGLFEYLEEEKGLVFELVDI